jgi:anti-sigma B factor antagonist
MQNENNTVHLTYQISKENDQTILASLKGRIVDTETANHLISAIVSELNPPINKVIVDLFEIDYINSNGLSSLISILTKTRTRGGEVVLININEKIQKLMLITKLNTVFTSADSKEEALTKLSAIKSN